MIENKFLRLAILITSILSLSSAQYANVINANTSWARSQLSRSASSIIIGGLFPITNAAGVPQSRGIHRAEAFKCAVKKYSNSSYLAGIQISYHIEDDKDDANIGLFKSLNFLEPGLMSVVGASSSQVSESVAKFMAPFNIPLVSYASSSAGLSDTVRYPTFLRTVPSDALQTQAMSKLAKFFQWDLVAAIGTDDTYGAYGLSAFRESATAAGLKVVCPTTIPFSQTAAVPSFSSCLQESKSKVVLLFMNEANAANVIAYLKNSTSFGPDMTFIASDSWATANAITLAAAKGVPVDFMRGSIGVIQNPGNLKEFQTCLSELNPVNNNYPEFRTYWQTRFRCSLNPGAFNGTICPISGTRSGCVCNGLETLGNDTPNNKAGLVMDAVQILVNALNMIKNKCTELQTMPNFPDPTICSGNEITGTQILTTIKYLTVAGRTGILSFKGVDRQSASYDFLQFNGESWVVIGTYTDDGTISINSEALTWRPGFGIPQSRIIPTFIDYHDIFAIVVAAVCSLGIFTAVSMLIYFFIKREHRMLKRSSPLFCMLMLSGNILIYVSLYMWAGPQTQELCASKVWLGMIGFAIIMGNLLAPTYRIYRIFTKGLRFKKLMTSDLLIMSGLVLVGEIILLLVWTLVDPVEPTVVQSTSNEFYNFISCRGQNESFQKIMIALFISYNGALLAVGTVLSYLTRKVYADYNDSKFIGMSMYNFAFILGVILPVYLTTGDGIGSVERQFMVRSLASLFGNTFTMLVLFAPKARQVWKNVRLENHGESSIKSGAIGVEKFLQKPIAGQQKFVANKKDVGSGLGSCIKVQRIVRTSNILEQELAVADANPNPINPKLQRIIDLENKNISERHSSIHVASRQSQSQSFHLADQQDVELKDVIPPVPKISADIPEILIYLKTIGDDSPLRSDSQV